MKEFILNYWQYLVIILVDLIGLVFILLRKKQSITEASIKEMIADVVPGYINLAEASGSTGRTKLCLVVDLVLKRIQKYISKSDEQFWISYIHDVIEAILSTPQKKGDSHEEKTSI